MFSDIATSNSEDRDICCADSAPVRGHKTNVVSAGANSFGEHVLPAAFHMQVAVLEHRGEQVLFSDPARARQTLKHR